MYIERITGTPALKSCLTFLEGHLPRSFYFVQHIRLLIQFGEGDFEIYRIKEHVNAEIYHAILSYCRDDAVHMEKYAVFYEDGYQYLAADALKTKIDMSKRHMMNTMPDYQLPLLNILYREKSESANIEYENKCFSMALKDIEKLPKALPESEHIIKRINPDLAHVICANWKFTRAGVEDMIRGVLETRVGFGAFVDGQMVSWVILSKYGAMANLFTLPEARGRGYATMVVNKLCRHVWELGITPFVDVEIDNHTGKALFTKFGFEVQENISWVMCKPILDKP